MHSSMELAGAILGIVFGALFFYQIVYIVVGFFAKPKEFTAKKNHRFGVLISARNESAVIEALIESIKQQNYPADLVDIFVVADNCTDNTAEIAAAAGAIVYTRFDRISVGKGYALNYLLGQIEQDRGLNTYDGFFVFDADNVLDENYICEMNKAFDNGYSILTSYRNSKNYDGNWISAGYALWFLREARFVNNARMILHTSCHVSGTGFLVKTEVFQRNNGWKHHLLTEDIEFSIDNIIQGEKIGYCGKAYIYDEQPTSFKVAWNQRPRWSKGFYQVLFRYGKDLVNGIFRKRIFGCYDMFMLLSPTLLSFLGGAIAGGYVLIRTMAEPAFLDWFVLNAFDTVVGMLGSSYLMMFALGALTTLTEWKRIHSSTWKKILYMFTFPIYMATYIPIGIVALFKKVTWTPIPHSVVKSAKDVQRVI